MPSSLQSGRDDKSSLQLVSWTIGSITRARLWRLWRLYAVICGIGVLIALLAADTRFVSFAMGMVVPGGGFAVWMIANPDSLFVSIVLACAAMGIFCISLVIWFGTGNIVLPPFIWFLTALLSTMPEAFGLVLDPIVDVTRLSIGLPIAMLTVTTASLLAAVRARKVIAPMKAVPLYRPPSVCEAASQGEIIFEDVKKLRLLFDRALQPIDKFEGFEWRDQFQTAAIRYQINFASYAIAMAQHHYLPAATSYVMHAQDNLLAKQGQERVWDYWRYENAWGNLRLGKDPVPRENIMYSGFVAAQMAYAQQADHSSVLNLRCNGQIYRSYDTRQITDLLAQQYRKSDYALLACEPNWIYPLCNMITATALKAQSVRSGLDDWEQIALHFRAGLTTEFMQPNGCFVPFRSSITGIAPPALGGSVMQAFPAFFLNSLFPDLAQQQWALLRADVKGRDPKACYWPIDVGNYGFSRASSYAASAAAAVEMGDSAMARELLDLLDFECPSHNIAGFPHRPNASLWAHSLELIARLGRQDGLSNIIAGPALSAKLGPYLSSVHYREVMIASAHVFDGNCLRLVLHPVNTPVLSEIGLAGLMPFGRYQTGVDGAILRADHKGYATLTVPISGRTQLMICPVA
jgi:hypothetical protein